jgi:hypothetical protein
VLFRSNVTLVNPYKGIVTGPGNNGRHLVRNMYGSPLATGIEIERCTAIGRLEGVDFNPNYWSDSGLPGSPNRDDPHAAWMYRNGTGLRVFRSDWQYVTFLNIHGYKIGFEKRNSTYGPGTGQLYGCELSHCATAVCVEYAGPNGFRFTNCTFDGDEYGLVTQEPLEEILAFHTCTIRGKRRAAQLKSQPSSTLVFQQCTLDGQLSRENGNLSLVGCTLRSAGDHVVLDRNARAAAIVGCTFDGGPRIVNHSPSSQIKIDHKPVAPSKIREFPKPASKIVKPAKNDLYVVTAGEWGARADGTHDDTAAIQKALNAAGARGGGIVFAPGGNYAFRGNLTVPHGVELRGSHDLPHTQYARGGSTLTVFAGRNQENAPPAVLLQQGSGLRGMTIAYPEDQDSSEIAPYPFTIQGQGENIYVVNVTAVNPYKVADFMTHRCDRHYLDCIRGNPYRLGIAVGGGSIDGEMRDNHFKPGPKGFAAHEAALEAFVLGDCHNESILQNMVFATCVGYHFISQGGKCASGLSLGAGTDGTSYAVVCDKLDPAGFDFINAGIDLFHHVKSGARKDKAFVRLAKDNAGEVRFYNTFFGGMPDASTVIDDGSVVMETVNFRRFGPFVVDRGSFLLANAYLGEDRTAGRAWIDTKPEAVVRLTALYLPSDQISRSSALPGDIAVTCLMPHTAMPLASKKAPSVPSKKKGK